MLGAKLLEIAQLTAPFDTGNTLRSIVIERQPNGWLLTSRGVVAPYNVFLEEGTILSEKHKGWWSVGVAGNTARYIDGYYNNRLNSDTINYKELVEKSRDFPAQNERFLQGLRK
jgi:hypothetical protein